MTVTSSCEITHLLFLKPDRIFVKRLNSIQSLQKLKFYVCLWVIGSSPNTLAPSVGTVLPPGASAEFLPPAPSPT
jgi:hypothetical protein